MTPSPWFGEGFRSHRGGSDMTFYHVYDNLSQSPFVRGRGITCGIVRPLEGYHINNLVTYKRMHEHLDWENRNMTPFISLHSTKESALRDASLRAQNTQVYDRAAKCYRQRTISSIRIAGISSAELDDLGVHYFSTKQLKHALDLNPNQKIWKHLSDREWFAIDHIPDDAVVTDWRPRAAIRAARHQ